MVCPTRKITFRFALTLCLICGSSVTSHFANAGQSSPQVSLSETKSYIERFCKTDGVIKGRLGPLDDYHKYRTKDERLVFTGDFVEIWRDHGSFSWVSSSGRNGQSCREHTDVLGKFKVNEVNVSHNNGTVNLSCISTDGTSRQCIETRTGPLVWEKRAYFGTIGERRGRNREVCSPDFHRIASVSRIDLKCNNATKVVKAFKHLQNLNGGTIKPYSDPFAD